MKASILSFFGVSSWVVSGLLMPGLMITAEPAIAQDICPNAMTQQALNRCANQSQRQADQNLTDFITTYQTRLRSEQVITLRHTQASWELFRRFSCEFQASRVQGGSIYPFVFSLCMGSKATARLTELQELAQCEGDDLSCPAPVRE
jgi:uncharacterized protein YecT (DUF1311 family)